MSEFGEQMFTPSSWSEMEVANDSWCTDLGGSGHGKLVTATGSLHESPFIPSTPVVPLCGLSTQQGLDIHIPHGVLEDEAGSNIAEYLANRSSLYSQFVQRELCQVVLRSQGMGESEHFQYTTGALNPASQSLISSSGRHESATFTATSDRHDTGPLLTKNTGNATNKEISCQDFGVQHPPNRVDIEHLFSPTFCKSQNSGLLLAGSASSGRGKLENSIPKDELQSTNSNGKRTRNEDPNRSTQLDFEVCKRSWDCSQSVPAIIGRVSSKQTAPVQSKDTAAILNRGKEQRVRARRGQATDPHSIAERNRRVRIAERLKTLQGLVPNSNKTDKASMLDEIIEHVNMLKLQVLSMSKVGGAGAVVPIITDFHKETCHSLVRATLNQGDMGTCSRDDMALAEAEVARLMADNINSAKQYLETKGLCLIPLSKVKAISDTVSVSELCSQGNGHCVGLTGKRRTEVQGASVTMGVHPSACGMTSLTNGIVSLAKAKAGEAQNANGRPGLAAKKHMKGFPRGITQ